MNKYENTTNIPDTVDLDSLIEEMQGFIDLPSLDECVKEFYASLEKEIEAGEVKLKKDRKRAKKLFSGRCRPLTRSSEDMEGQR